MRETRRRIWRKFATDNSDLLSTRSNSRATGFNSLARNHVWVQTEQMALQRWHLEVEAARIAAATKRAEFEFKMISARLHLLRIADTMRCRPSEWCEIVDFTIWLVLASHSRLSCSPSWQHCVKCRRSLLAHIQCFNWTCIAVFRVANVNNPNEIVARGIAEKREIAAGSGSESVPLQIEWKLPFHHYVQL